MEYTCSVEKCGKQFKRKNEYDRHMSVPDEVEHYCNHPGCDYKNVGGDRGCPFFIIDYGDFRDSLEDKDQNLLAYRALLPAYCCRQDLGPLAAVETF